MTTVLEKIKTGMKVLDQAENEIGTVDYVKFGDEDPNYPGAGTAGVSPMHRDDSFAANIFDVFSPDEIPDELKASLLREGFVRIESSGLFHADRYILPHQIQSVSVSQNEVLLSVMKAALIKHD